MSLQIKILWAAAQHQDMYYTGELVIVLPEYAYAHYSVWSVNHAATVLQTLHQVSCEGIYIVHMN